MIRLSRLACGKEIGLQVDHYPRSDSMHSNISSNLNQRSRKTRTRTANIKAKGFNKGAREDVRYATAESISETRSLNPYPNRKETTLSQELEQVLLVSLLRYPPYARSSLVLLRP